MDKKKDTGELCRRYLAGKTTISEERQLSISLIEAERHGALTEDEESCLMLLALAAARRRDKRSRHVGINRSWIMVAASVAVAFVIGISLMINGFLKEDPENMHYCYARIAGVEIVDSETVFAIIDGELEDASEVLGDNVGRLIDRQIVDGADVLDRYEVSFNNDIDEFPILMEM